jgi:cytoskeletal protein RodZ
MPALGEGFRSAREARGLTLSDVAEQIHIRSVYLNAIETEDWSAIGAPVYVRGFIRTYARFLGLDPEAAVAAFNESVPQEKQAAPVTAVERERRGLSPWAIGGIVVALLLVGLVGYEYLTAYGPGHDADVAQATSAPQPGTASPGSQAGTTPDALASATPVPSPTPSPPPRHQLAIHVTAASWLRVMVDGKTVVEGILPAGATKTVRGHVADVRVGNAGGVRLVVDGRTLPPLGKDGDVVEQRYIL